MTFEELKAMDDTYVMHTYARFPVDIDHGQGATLYSLAGKEYIDFTSGIGVNSLGYGDPTWISAITQQIQKLGHISNLYYTQPGPKLAKELCTRTGMDKVFFGNSGAEANEAMIKLARKYSFDKYGKGRSTIITLNHSFHGRTMATITATGQPHYHTYFFPFVEDFRYADPTLESIQAQGGDDVCAVMLELMKEELPMDCTFVFTAQKEVGARGAFGAAFSVTPEVALVVDGADAADLAGVPAHKQGCSLGGGVVLPYMDQGAIADRGLFEALRFLAEAGGIPWQTMRSVAGRTDTAAIQRTKEGVRTAAVSIPVRYPRTPSGVTCLRDAEAALALIRAFVGHLAEKE